MSSSTKLSIVSPVHNEELCLEEFISEVIKYIPHQDFEIILVDDGSQDNSYQVIQKICSQNPRVKGLILSRNFGHQIALDAGLRRSTGENIIMLDSDLQHPPSLIPLLLEKRSEGFHIVNTVRVKTEDASLFKRVSSKIFYILINYLSDTKITPGAADFRLMSRASLNELLKMPETDRFTRGMVNWLGFNSTYINYSARSRYAGASSYSIWKMVYFALTCVTSFSSKPLRISFVLGLITIGILFLYLAYCLVDFFYHGVVRGWSSLYFTMTFLGSVQLISIGILGEYIARIYKEVKNRPSYIVQEEVGINEG